MEVLMCKGGGCNDAIHLQTGPIFAMSGLEHWNHRFSLYCLGVLQYMHLNFGGLY